MRRVMRITFRRAQAKWKLWYPTSEQNDLRQTYCICWNQLFFLSFVLSLSLSLCVPCKRSTQQRHMFCTSLYSQRCKNRFRQKKTLQHNNLYIDRSILLQTYESQTVKFAQQHSIRKFWHLVFIFCFVAVCMVEAAKVATRSKPKRDDFQYTHKMDTLINHTLSYGSIT